MKNEPRIIDSMRIRYIYMATAVAFFLKVALILPFKSHALKPNQPRYCNLWYESFSFDSLKTYYWFQLVELDQYQNLQPKHSIFRRVYFSVLNSIFIALCFDGVPTYYSFSFQNMSHFLSTKRDNNDSQ